MIEAKEKHQIYSEHCSASAAPFNRKSVRGDRGDQVSAQARAGVIHPGHMCTHAYA